eukprot:CAMPEP_0170819800 /NCGR_PEP_ID=MMETSP0733-20121128/41864_1 /TAXON_ID=186038 /ORGANISM="Fragilariopsis kerguelensis, Strain L26-C5" /LENGTH=50 /DNA_ID=CAMNT_0011180807 /DNA_START=27 /DNA_END=179 /DNA_ORIENTATION=+
MGRDVICTRCVSESIGGSSSKKETEGGVVTVLPSLGSTAPHVNSTPPGKV